MSERGMGSAVGQVPDYTEMITSWVKEVATTPVLVKLTPNITDIRAIGRAAQAGGADGLSLINTLNSIVAVDLDTFNPVPHVAGRGSHGGYCGPAVKPIALHMVQSLASDPEITIPISGIGGIQAWQDATEYLLLGASSVQVCTAVMHYGFRLVEHMISGLERWMIDKGFSCLDDFVGRTVSSIGGWGELDLGYKVVAEIDQDRCIHCGLCYIACEDGAHQSIRRTEIAEGAFVASPGSGGLVIEHSGSRTFMPGAGGGYINRYEIDQETCVGCNLCSLLCPVEGCITMVSRDSGLPQMTWNEYQAKLERGEVEEIGPPRHR
jgi:dihydropyrimidine dehydrogenase (NAD+) subunit PreA